MYEHLQKKTENAAIKVILSDFPMIIFNTFYKSYLLKLHSLRYVGNHPQQTVKDGVAI